ncbi:hypothetical protein ABPG75_002519 [Micractinium tetrahymenae]
MPPPPLPAFNTAPARAAAAALAAAALLLAAARPAAACSSFVVDCGDGAVVSGRTLDFSTDLASDVNITLFPKAVTFTGLAISEARATVGATYGLDGPAVAWDGLNEAGLAVTYLWQSNITFHQKYDPEGPPEAITVVDLPYVLLGRFSTVQEVREYLDPAQLQLTTDIVAEGVRSVLTSVFTSDPDIHAPDADGTLWVGLHLHVADATGDGLPVEGTANGSYALYDTIVATNEPSFPDMLSWASAYSSHNFSSVPGIANAPQAPWLTPNLVPFNSMVDGRQEGYLGSQSRFLRLTLQQTNCSTWQWANASWSPAGAGADPQTLALKRAENWLGSVMVPVSVLGQSGPELEAGYDLYATQIAFLKDQTGARYMYRSAANNGWNSIDLAALADSRDSGRWFPIGVDAPERPFAVDVSAGGGAVAQ